MGVHVIALHAPGKILEEDLVVHPAADVDHEGPVNDSAGIDPVNSSHGVNKWTPFFVLHREARTAHEIVVLDAAKAVVAVETAGIGDEAEVCKPGERHDFTRSVPAAKALLIDHRRELSVGNSGINVPVRN